MKRPSVISAAACFLLLFAAAPVSQALRDVAIVPMGGQPEGFAALQAGVGAFLQAQLAESQATYLVGQFAFGDLSLVESSRSVEIFARDVMPVFGC